MLRRAAVTWLLFIPVAILNAALRESVLKPAVGDLTAHQISTLTGSAAMFSVAYLMLHDNVEEVPDRTLAKIGIGWLGGTILFEFGAGHYLFGNSWDKLLADYNVTQGRIWPLVLLTLLAAPLLIKRLVRRTGGHAGTPGSPARSV